MKISGEITGSPRRPGAYRVRYRAPHVALCALALLCGLAAGCSPSSDSADASESAASTSGESKSSGASAIPVAVRRIESERFVDRFSVPGTAQPVSSLRVSAEAGGRVLYAPFETGDRIRRGQLLIRTDAELDESRIEVLESQLEAARREARRLEKLVRKGLATPQQLDQARTQVEQLELNIEQAKIGLTKSRVYAPVRGHVVRKFVDDGEFVGPGAPVAEIVDYSTIEVHVAVPESQIRYVREGTSLEVHFHALDRTVDAEVSDRALLPDAKTRTYSVEVRVPNEEREILPGMRATVRIVREVLDETLVIPRDAVLQGVHRNEVIIVEQKSESEDSGVARVRPVDLGPGRGPKVVALSGLEADALLVTRGHRGLVEGTRVQIVERQPAGELAEKSTGDTSTGTPAPNLQARDAQDRDTPDGDDAAAGDAAASGGKAKSAPGGDE